MSVHASRAAKSQATILGGQSHRRPSQYIQCVPDTPCGAYNVVVHARYMYTRRGLFDGAASRSKVHAVQRHSMQRGQGMHGDKVQSSVKRAYSPHVCNTSGVTSIQDKSLFCDNEVKNLNYLHAE